LNALLAQAVEVIPEALKSRTPVAVKATTGLRLLTPSQRDGITHAAGDKLRNQAPFLVPAKGATIVMEGREEGVVFEPAGGNLEEEDHKYGLRFAGRAHTLYQRSFPWLWFCASSTTCTRASAFHGGA
jgi:Golgi nucleoside diphosphatase